MVLLATNSAERRAFDVLQEIRRVSETPVMLFGPSSSEREQIEGLRLGADDYVVESVSPAVLAARIEAVQRRTGFGRPGDRPPDFHSGALAIWYRRRLVTVRGAPAKLTPLEYQLLHQLAIRAGEVIPSSVLLESVWGDEYGATTKYLKVFVNRLRSKLGHGHDLPVIETERRVGYRLVRATPSVGEDVG
jgi:two-component system KDP operon response regulator KdpE